MTTRLDEGAKKVVLNISAEKMKTIQNWATEIISQITICQQQIENVSQFTYTDVQYPRVEIQKLMSGRDWVKLQLSSSVCDNPENSQLHETATVCDRRMYLAGHILCTSDSHHSKPEKTWKAKKSWQSTFRDDLDTVKIKREDAERHAADRQHWWNLLPDVPSTEGSKTKTKLCRRHCYYYCNYHHH